MSGGYKKFCKSATEISRCNNITGPGLVDQSRANVCLEIQGGCEMDREEEVGTKKGIGLEESTPREREYYTPGEISIILDGIVSRSTVTRLFDQGKLEGLVNPVTGRREIAWHSVVEWLKSKGMFPENVAIIEKKRGERWTRLRREGTERNHVARLQSSKFFHLSDGLQLIKS